MRLLTSDVDRDRIQCALQRIRPCDGAVPRETERAQDIRRLPEVEQAEGHGVVHRAVGAAEGDFNALFLL